MLWCVTVSTLNIACTECVIAHERCYFDLFYVSLFSCDPRLAFQCFNRTPDRWIFAPLTMPPHSKHVINSFCGVPSVVEGNPVPLEELANASGSGDVNLDFERFLGIFSGVQSLSTRCAPFIFIRSVAFPLLRCMRGSRANGRARERIGLRRLQPRL